MQVIYVACECTHIPHARCHLRSTFGHWFFLPDFFFFHFSLFKNCVVFSSFLLAFRFILFLSSSNKMETCCKKAECTKTAFGEKHPRVTGSLGCQPHCVLPLRSHPTWRKPPPCLSRNLYKVSHSGRVS